MTNNIYAIYDEKAECYNSPFPLATDGLAKRSFENACQNPNTDLYKFLGDFKLYAIATWDDSNGKFENVVPPRFIAVNKRQLTTEEEINLIEKEVEKKESK